MTNKESDKQCKALGKKWAEGDRFQQNALAGLFPRQKPEGWFSSVLTKEK